MAEEQRSIINMEVDSDGAGEEDEEFYENIEAPKFVDLTTPDHRRSGDDRYWFCSRVGCDQKHEEELDSEAIYKNFVLRVMAARSPNVRLQKALNRTASSKYMRCPGSAPPKSSKPRLSRLAVISSISGKLADHNKAKVTPQSKLTSTPKSKTKQVAAKYLTTPKKKNCLPNPNSFRSVQNPKPTTLATPQNRTVAKALVFHSPKKGIAVKTSVELRTPLSKLCDGMKRLEVTSQKKRVKDPALGSTKPLPVNSSRKQRVTFKDQSSEKIPKQSQTLSARGIKSSRTLKSKTKGNLMEQCPYKETLAGIHSELSEANAGHLDAKKMSGQCSSTDQQVEENDSCSDMPSLTGTSDLMSSNASRDLQSLPISEQTGGNDVRRAEVPNKEKNDFGEGNAHDNERAYLESENHSADCQTSAREVVDSDDKENASAFDENRGHNRIQSDIRKNGMQEAPGKIKKVAQASEKNLKEGGFRKPKLTNPKPFRFRTVERGILKEANLEKKVLLAPKKATAKASRFIEGNLPKKHEKNIHGDDALAEYQDKCNTPVNDQRDSQRKILGDLMKGAKMKMNKPGVQEASSGSASVITPNNSNCSLHPETILRKTKSPLKTFQPQSLASSKKQVSSCLTPGQKLCVIKETPHIVLKPKRKGDREEKTATGSAASEPSRRRRPITIPKEPNFHSTHRPKSCTKQVA